MTIAKVIGTMVSTNRADDIPGAIYYFVETCDHHGKLSGNILIALDMIKASLGDLVLLTQGSSCRWTMETADKAADVLIVAIVELIDEKGKITYRK